ncbi:hypothetical protein BHU72_07550 [Desulfuribacillus stibiiarsenatis]|uniref:Uncharacterized protein n=1 Tax=Desulfuribacillus stibiiarsenatis TaxID=1390249 RepID=A0A1E5L3G5_9FIRM|nr:hypothetical protein [Desulfuribacillus stibiiarsenatis]OEH84685.1 hypothetical protein BHU72_07550 [Desulfuribacillus stibiiarsenatis]
MNDFKLEDYSRYFKTETIEIVRWDQLDIQNGFLLFSQEPIKTASHSLIRHIKTLSKDEIDKLDVDLTDWRTRQTPFRIIIGFIEYYIEIDNEPNRILIDDVGVMLYELDQNQGRLGLSHYCDPYWLLYKHFFIDLFNVLEMWTYINSEQYIIDQEKFKKLIY